MGVENRSSEELLKLARELSRADPAGETHERWDVIQELHKRPEEGVAEGALRWCRSEDATDRALGADILGQLGFDDRQFPFRDVSLPVLEDLLADQDPGVAASALIALHHLGPEQSLDKIVPLAGHPNDDVRYSVAFALQGQEGLAAVNALISLSSDSAAHVRDWATFGLGAQIDNDTPEIREALLRRVADADADTRAEALAGLAKRREPRVVSYLKDALKLPSVGSLEVQTAADLAEPELLPELEALRLWWDVDTSLLEEAIEKCRSAKRSST